MYPKEGSNIIFRNVSNLYQTKRRDIRQDSTLQLICCFFNNALSIPTTYRRML